MKANTLLKINHETCLKCGGCIASFPEIFEFDENQKILVKEKEIELEEIPNIKAICPVAAIIDK